MLLRLQACHVPPLRVDYCRYARVRAPALSRCFCIASSSCRNTFQLSRHPRTVFPEEAMLGVMGMINASEAGIAEQPNRRHPAGTSYSYVAAGYLSIGRRSASRTPCFSPSGYSLQSAGRSYLVSNVAHGLHRRGCRGQNAALLGQRYGPGSVHCRLGHA